MRHLKKINPSRPGMGFKLPEGNFYYPLSANFYPHYDEFLDTVIDADEWADVTTQNSAGVGAITYAASFADFIGGTATGATSTIRLRSAMSSSANLYNIPFRTTFNMRMNVTAGAGIAPTGGLDIYLGVRSTDETHLAQFHFTCSTAGSSSLAAPVANMEVRAGSTGAGFIASAAANVWNTAASVLRSATALTTFVIETTHRGVWFGYKDDQNDIGPANELFFSRAPGPRIDLNYFIDMRMVTDGTAGFTQSAPVTLSIDNVTVEQLTPTQTPWFGGVARDLGAVRSVMLAQAVPTGTAGLATTGAGVFLGVAVTSTATAALDSYIAVYDASAGSTACFNYANDASAGARLLWMEQVRAAGSVPSTLSHNASGGVPAMGIPFFRGLVVGGAAATGTTTGTSALNALVTFQAQR